MARVQIEQIVDHLDTEFRNALKETIKQHFSNLSFDERELFRTFRRMVGRKCNNWETVPDSYVEKV